MTAMVLLIFIVAGWIYWLVAWWLVRTFYGHPQEPDPNFAPPVSILKPLKGADPEIYRNFVSFCEQVYPEFELLFGVAEADDPVIPLVERLQREFAHLRIRLIVVPTTQVNRKASILHCLASEARFDTLVASDSDMRVGPDYLQRLVAPLADPETGLVTCLYRGREPLTLTARLEALYMGATFLPSVLVARPFLRMRFALGATVALRSRDLARIGGFAAVGDYLADDYQLGAKIADLGLKVQLSDYVVESVLGATTFHEQWNREVRWAQCTRVSRPLEYPGLLFTFSTPFALIYLVASGFTPLGWALLGFSLLVRWFVAWQVTAYSDNRSLRRWFIYLPLRDALSVVIFVAGALGRRVVWRGEEYVLLSDGRLSPVVAAQRHALEDVD